MLCCGVYYIGVFRIHWFISSKYDTLKFIFEKLKNPFSLLSCVCMSEDTTALRVQTIPVPTLFNLEKDGSDNLQ